MASVPSIALVRPNGTTTASKSFTGSSWFASSPKLDATGTWKPAVQPAAGDTGDVSVRISYARTAAPELPINTNRTIRLTEPFTVQAFTFSAAAGQRPILSAPVNDWTSASGHRRRPLDAADQPGRRLGRLDHPHPDHGGRRDRPPDREGDRLVSR